MTTRRRRAGVVRRLARRPLALISSAWLLIVVTGSLFPTLVTSHDPLNQDLLHSLEGPSRAHLLGTDVLGRDLLSRVTHGGAGTLSGMAVAVVVAVTIGVTFGLLAGFFGGLIDAAITRLTEILFAIPGIVTLLVILAVFPRAVTAAMAAFGVLLTPGLIRIVRSATVAVRAEPFVAAAEVSGLSRVQVLWHHVLPRLGGLVIVQASLLAALALVVQAGLGFLGLGAQPPQPSWGSLINDARAVIGRQSWMLVPPGVVLGLTAMALALLGDAVRDASAERWSVSKLSRRPSARPVLAVFPATEAGPASPLPPAGAVLSVRHLSIAIPSTGGPVTVVDDVSFDIAPGETVGIVGESGCGKTVTVLGILGLVPGGGAITGGQCFVGGHDVVRMTARELEGVRGRSVGFVAQEPTVSLDPTFRVGAQLAEAVRRHTGVSRAQAHRRAAELLASVRLPDPDAIARRYPHQVSGGMAQRIAIALALAGDPSLLIADEPTTALDVTVQAEILDLLRVLSAERSMAVLLVTHDWGVVADICDRAIVMYAGQVVESSSVKTMFHRPLHPYTVGLLASNPQVARAHRLPTIPGTVPAPEDWPSSCRFALRCQRATDACRAGVVEISEPAPAHQARCLHPGPGPDQRVCA